MKTIRKTDRPDLSALWGLLRIKWVAMDKDGSWWGYTQKPTLNQMEKMWESGGDIYYIPHKYSPDWSSGWRKSLMRRPKDGKP